MVFKLGNFRTFSGLALFLLASVGHAYPECPETEPSERPGQAPQYLPIVDIEGLEAEIPTSLRDCFEELITVARSRAGMESEVGEALDRTAAGKVLRLLWLTPVERVSFVELVDLLHKADSPSLWISALSTLMSGPPVYVDELDMDRLRSLAPENSKAAMYYVEVLRRRSSEPRYWEGVGSDIIMQHPALVTSDALSELDVPVDICRMREWLPRKSGKFLDALITQSDSNERHDIGALIDPNRLDPLSVMRILNASYGDWSHLSDQWQSEFEDNLGNWVELGMPEALRSSELWGLDQRAMLQDPGELLEEIDWFLESRDWMSAANYLTPLDSHQAQSVRRFAATRQFALKPSLTAFSKMIDLGIAPEFIAHEAENRQIEELVQSAASEPPSPALMAFISSLPCSKFRESGYLQFATGDDSVNPVLSALQQRTEECR